VACILVLSSHSLQELWKGATSEWSLNREPPKDESDELPSCKLARNEQGSSENKNLKGLD
jgi:hypothetical protein